MAKFHYNPCKYWCFGIYLASKYLRLVTMVGFWRKTCRVVQQRLQLPPGPHKEHACFPTIPHLKLSNLCIFQALCSYIGENLPVFHTKVACLWGYFAKGIWWNFAYFPTKSPQKSYILLLCSIKSVHKIKILCLSRVCFSKPCLLWHFHPKMSNSMLHVMSSIYVQL